ncbi:MAG: 5'-methylthioadenosine/adenosylhomocysteine nucleosidase [Gammaproteobacteria bacterium]|nr:5'-methylthioadenosine/adenosylhomocysteine nucleosidase [Gammaproteobacteria bacterium]
MLLLLSAMPEELEALLPRLEHVSADTVASRQVYRGRLGTVPVALAFSRWGKVAAASTTAQLILREQPRAVVFTGIAGALQDELEPGDLVVARQLFHHDLDASPFYAPTVVPLLGRAALRTDDALSAGLIAAARAWRAQDPAAAPRRIVHGDVATGDQVIGTGEARAAVRQRVPGAACVEMEGAAVAQVCEEFGLPFACLRMISDRADERLTPDEVYAMARRSGASAAEILARAIGAGAFSARAARP